jgi:hypothetical protein
MNNEIIRERIQMLMIERVNLEQSHAGMVQGNQVMNQEFQQQVAKNQTRFAQISGAITELQQLIKPPTEEPTNNDHLSSTPNRNHRAADVCPVVQPEGR